MCSAVGTVIRTVGNNGLNGSCGGSSPADWPELSVLARHVEVKIAFRLLDRPPGDEVVVMGRKVCGRDPITAGYPYTCDKLLPFLLQEGTTLTVVEDDGTRVTYRGRRPR
ncbi:DddA-like double-stranded DNA deaminase toxin [Saccharothrix lopnurensis]|uniref:DddA-like double-stranded DNA deaminase toxin n=1 Tax=Saccharothrix lopnurensis TaxID=1670621 RepID=A0ABW1PA28_9PSEU